MNDLLVDYLLVAVLPVMGTALPGNTFPGLPSRTIPF